MGLSTHVLDTARGRPAEGVPITLARLEGGRAVELGTSATNADGRVPSLLGTAASLERGTYRLTFGTAAYYARQGASCFYPEVQITFEVTRPEEHHHVPLLLAPYGFSTYRGS